MLMIDRRVCGTFFSLNVKVSSTQNSQKGISAKKPSGHWDTRTLLPISSFDTKLKFSHSFRNEILLFLLALALNDHNILYFFFLRL